MQKSTRQQRLSEIIQSMRISNQHELLNALELAGVSTNQATISRDLNELGIAKVKGAYRIPQIAPGESQAVKMLKLETAGDNLIVVKTLPGSAMGVAFSIDNLKLTSVVGTLAGDDTVFIAVKNRKNQNDLIKTLLRHFQS
jgi:transcriptional regulator of arginine metabolism